LGWLAQEGVSKAVAIAEASSMAPINYIQVIIALLADILLMNHQLKWTDILGTILILFFTFLSTLIKSGVLCCC
jgi:drug/metabolite transporter (DMT)-like permease